MCSRASGARSITSQIHFSSLRVPDLITHDVGDTAVHGADHSLSNDPKKKLFIREAPKENGSN